MWAVWDETPERGRAEAKALNVPFYEKLDDIPARSDIDGVIIDTPTNLHHDVMIAAAQAGKHIFTEKVIAPTLREVNEILKSTCIILMKHELCGALLQHTCPWRVDNR